MEILAKEDGDTVVRLTQKDVRLLCNAMLESLEIEDWEFHTRMGATKEAVERLRSLFAALS